MNGTKRVSVLPDVESMNGLEKEQVARIVQMERHLDVVQAAVTVLSEALDQFGAAEGSFAALSEYYGSEAWRRDFAADEAGRLPQDLKRGVLSEDGVWNVLEAWRELERLRSLPARCRD